MPIASRDLLAVMAEVLHDSVASSAECIVVTAAGCFFRFDADKGTLAATIHEGHAAWPDLQRLLLRLKVDAEQHGYPECVAIPEGMPQAIIFLSANESYFKGHVGAIVGRLGHLDAIRSGPQRVEVVT